jgi:DNA-binding MarR family transcriptional regulator
MKIMARSDTGSVERRIVASLDKLTRVYRLLLWDAAKEEGLSPLQVQFLLCLKDHPGTLRTVSALAGEFDLTKATVSEAVSALEAKGLVAREREGEDRRSRRLRVTPSGGRVARRVAGWAAILEEHIGGFPRGTKEAVMLFLMELIKSLFDDGVISVTRMCLACENFERNAETGDGGKLHRCRLTGKLLADAELTIGCPGHRPAGAC